MWNETDRSVIFTPSQIARRVTELGDEITRQYEGEKLVMVVVMQGAAIFFADLIRSVRLSVECDMVSVSSYASSTSPVTGPRLIAGPRVNWKDRHLLFVDTIVDTGKTAAFLQQLGQVQQAASSQICCLLDKTSRRECQVKLDYVGFTIPDKFVVGYGLDYQGCFRNLPAIEAFKQFQPGSPVRFMEGLTK